VIAVVVLLTLGSGYLATRLDFDDTIGALRSNKSKGYQVQQEIASRFGAALSYMMAIAEAPTREEAVRLTETIEERLKPFVDEGVVAAYDSVLTYLPPSSQQQRVFEALAADTHGAFDSARIRATFLDALDKNGLNAAPFEPFLDRLTRFLHPPGEVKLEDLESAGLGRILERYVRTDERGTRIVTYLFLADKRWKREAPPGLVEALTAGEDGIVVTGTNVVGREFRRLFSAEARHAVLLGLLVVFVLLWVDFRSLRLTSIAMIQLICGVIMMLGMMKVSGIALNYVNAFVATMILGVGIDYSIHLVHRMSLSGGKVDGGLLETGKAVVMAALTNIAGFGTLALGNYPALQSFGTVALFGSLTCLFTALTLVPALMVRAESAQPAQPAQPADPGSPVQPANPEGSR
jgi:predicted RND superfamily exporter protein